MAILHTTQMEFMMNIESCKPDAWVSASRYHFVEAHRPNLAAFLAPSEVNQVLAEPEMIVYADGQTTPRITL